MTDPVTDPLEQAWTLLVAHWDQDDRHKAFVQLATTLERLPDAAGRYRSLLVDPLRAQRARRGLDLLLQTAMALMTPPIRAPRPPRGLWLVPLAALGMVLALTLATATALRRPSLASPAMIGGEIVFIALVPWHRLGKRS